MIFLIVHVLKRLQTKRSLQGIYLFLFAIGGLVLLITHSSNPPAFDILRLPRYLREIEAIAGLPWPLSFDLYHIALILLAVTAGGNLLGITFSNYRFYFKLGFFSSLIGMVTLLFLLAFFLYPIITRLALGTINMHTSIVFALFFACLLFVDYITFLYFKNSTRH